MPGWAADEADDEEEMLVVRDGSEHEFEPSDVLSAAEMADIEEVYRELDSDGNGVDENCDGVDGQACFGPRSFVLFLMPLAAWVRRTETVDDSAP